MASLTVQQLRYNSIITILEKQLLLIIIFTIKFYWSLICSTIYMHAGVAHQDDLQYIFNITEWFPSLQKDDPEVLTTERVTAMWASFALSGDPIPKNNDKFKDVSWEPYTKENQRYLEINDNLVMKTGLYLDRMNLWDKLFALWPIGSNPVHESH